jgi:sec-independent protein translocase protein TatA
MPSRYPEKASEVLDMGPIALMGPLGLPELLIILFIVVLIFGANRLPALATGLGKSIRSFKDGMKEGDDTEIKKT